MNIQGRFRSSQTSICPSSPSDYIQAGRNGSVLLNSHLAGGFSFSYFPVFLLCVQSTDFSQERWQAQQGGGLRVWGSGRGLPEHQYEPLVSPGPWVWAAAGGPSVCDVRGHLETPMNG